RLKSVKAILTIKLTAYHRPISICFVGKKLFLIFNKMFTISPCSPSSLMTKKQASQPQAGDTCFVDQVRGTPETDEGWTNLLSR
ncbi:hypothetical protein, partial [Aeromonas caviae]|uniref:hypothetical protein n=1 Tax=Aeromonas caviae TaxID=648 RepID=UPI002B243435